MREGSIEVAPGRYRETFGRYFEDFKEGDISLFPLIVNSYPEFISKLQSFLLFVIVLHKRGVVINTAYCVLT